MEEEDDDITDTDLLCPKVNGTILEKVVEFCTHYETVEPMTAIKTPFKKDASTLGDVVSQDFYKNYIEKNTREEVMQLIQAANFLDVQPLLTLSVLAMCVGINNKSVEEIQAIFKITPPGQEKNASS